MSTDTLIVDVEDWQGADTTTIGDVGGGVLAEDLASSGEDGPAFLYGSVSLPADNGKEIAGRFVTIPAGLNFQAEEDGEVVASAEVDGTYVTEWQMYVNMVPTGPVTPLTFVFGAPSATDTTPPEMVGELSYSGLTPTSCRISWEQATDNVGVTGYRRSVNGGAYTNIGNTLFTDVALNSGTGNSISILAYDGALNDSEPLTISVTAPTVSIASFVSEVVGDFNEPHANLTGWKVRIYDIPTGALIAAKTNLFSNELGLISYTEAACVKGTEYHVIFIHPDGTIGVQKETPS